MLGPSSSTGVFNFNTKHGTESTPNTGLQEQAGASGERYATLTVFAFPLCKQGDGDEGFALCLSVPFSYSKEKANFDSAQ